MENFDYWPQLIGGAAIGASAGGLLWTHGRIMGISGILGGLLKPSNDTRLWRILFLLGIVAGSLWIPKVGASTMTLPFDRGLWSAVIGGLLVGWGTTLGSGCTSGHGVCGISRLSKRSLMATIVFMAFGIITVAAMNLLTRQGYL